MKKLAFFIAEGFQPLDLFGPLDTFDEVNSFVSDSYQSQIVSFKAGPIKSANGHTVISEYAISDLYNLDYLIICGGTGMRQLVLSTVQQLALKRLADDCEKVISICTGAFVLAQIYQNVRLTLTTHWRHCQQLAANFPHCDVQNDPLYVNQGKVWSSAGILSGVDVALEIVRQDFGNTVAASTAKELVVYLQRKGSQNQFSDLLKTQSSSSLRLSPIIEWLLENLHKPITVTHMAEKLCVSERQLSRLFKAHLHNTPAQYLNHLRMHQARDLLSKDNRSLQEVSRLVGFVNYESFRRSFERHFGLSPSVY